MLDDMAGEWVKSPIRCILLGTIGAVLGATTVYLLHVY